MPASAIVARSNPAGLEFLVRTERGAAWSREERDADHFENLHEATRAALVLPSHLRAFALPVAPLAA